MSPGHSLRIQVLKLVHFVEKIAGLRSLVYKMRLVLCHYWFIPLFNSAAIVMKNSENRLKLSAIRSRTREKYSRTIKYHQSTSSHVALSSFPRQFSLQYTWNRNIFRTYMTKVRDTNDVYNALQTSKSVPISEKNWTETSSSDNL